MPLQSIASKSCFTAVLAAILALAIPSSVLAAPLIFSGWDDNAGVGSDLPNSDAARDSFIVASARGVGTLDFQNQPLGFNTQYTLNSARGIGLILSAGFIEGYGAGISEDTTQPSYGFNTSRPGARFLRLFASGAQPGGGTATFQFSLPQHSFGFYVTGIFGDASSPLTVELNDGESHILVVPDLPASTAQFFGFVSQNTFTSVTLRLNYPGSGYLIGLDDVYAEVPEPSAGVLVGVGILLLAVWAASRRRTAREEASRPLP